MQSACCGTVLFWHAAQPSLQGDRMGKNLIAGFQDLELNAQVSVINPLCTQGLRTVPAALNLKLCLQIILRTATRLRVQQSESNQFAQRHKLLSSRSVRS